MILVMTVQTNPHRVAIALRPLQNHVHTSGQFISQAVQSTQDKVLQSNDSVQAAATAYLKPLICLMMDRWRDGCLDTTGEVTGLKASSAPPLASVGKGRGGKSNTSRLALAALSCLDILLFLLRLR